MRKAIDKYRKEWEGEDDGVIVIHARLCAVAALVAFATARLSVWAGDWFWSIAMSALCTAFVIGMWLDVGVLRNRRKGD